MDDPGCRQGVTLSERGELVPKEPTPAIPPRQPFLPNPHDLIGVPAYSSKVARYAVVGIVAPHHRGQMGALVRDRLMPVAPTPVRHRRQRAGVAVLCRYLPHHILACPRLAPDVGEAEEGERGTVRLRMVSPIWWNDPPRGRHQSLLDPPRVPEGGWRAGQGRDRIAVSCLDHCRRNPPAIIIPKTMDRSKADEP